MTDIQKISREFDYDKLIYYSKTPGVSTIHFMKFRGPLHIYNEIKNGDKTIKAAEEE